MPLVDKTEIGDSDRISSHIMAHIKDDRDLAVARDSPLDWGQSTDASAPGTSEGPSSRYDPKAMSRIVDINDLVDSGDDTDDDDEIIRQKSFKSRSSVGSRSSMTSQDKNKKSYRIREMGLGCRQVVILISIVGIIIGASVAIGAAIIKADSPNDWMPSMNVRGGEGNINGNSNQEQQLLEMAERVITACAESRLDESMSECQNLCHASMCCFEDGNYSCEDDAIKNCAVYAGCANLMEADLFGGAEEDEE